jgi:general secretion pathway protein D
MLRVVIVVLLIPAVARAAPDELGEAPYRCKQHKGDVVVSFKPEIEVKELVAWVVGFTCKEFVYDARIVGARKVTIVAPNKLSHGDAWRMFLAALQTINYTVVPKGKTLKIVEAPSARKETVPVVRSPDGSDQMVRYVYKPSHGQADALLPAFQALKSDAGDVQIVGSMLLVTDFASHVKEMLALARLVDVPHGSDGVYLLPVRHADASKLHEKITGILGTAPATPATPAGAGKPDPKAGSTATPSKIVVDERTNTLIVAASEAGFERVKALVERLDVALEIEGGTTYHVVRLGSAVAEDLARTLTEVISGQQVTRPSSPARPAGGPGPGPAPAGATPPAPTGSAAPEAPPTVDGPVRVIGDKLTNSLIVMSGARDFLAIRELIRQLDQPRRQVFIEVVVLEVSATSDLSIGMSAHGGLPGANGLLVGGIQLPGLKSTNPKSLAGAEGLVGGILGNALPGAQSLLGLSIPSYGLLFQTLAARGHANVISTPSMLGIDNQPTKQSVGVDIAYERGAVLGFGVDPNAVQRSFERRKLPHEIEITPHISADDTVLLDVKHTAEELSGEDKAGQPIWNTRAFETSVVVRDQQTVVIGGLMQERQLRTESKVPLLGDVPLLGYLFKTKKSEKRKSSLLVMLTPYIIKDQMDLQAIQERKFREHQELDLSLRRLDGTAYQPKVDYGRKRGLVEEIHRAVIAVEEEMAARERVRSPMRVQPGLVEAPKR